MSNDITEPEVKCSVGLACDLCGECVDVCPEEALKIIDSKLIFDWSVCSICEYCMDVCPECAIRIDEVKK